MNISEIPIPAIIDSYKAGHFEQYPEVKQFNAYGEFRRPFEGLLDDRIVFVGIRYIIETYLSKKWTEQDVRKAALFFSTHNANFTEYPFPKELFLRIVNEHDGYFPVKIQALREGSVVYPHVPLYQITAGQGTAISSEDFARLVTFFESILTQVWYPSNVATLSKATKHIINMYFDETADEEDYWKLSYKLHDFGLRGSTSVESAVIGGIAHLLSFAGSDNVPACYFAQFELNNEIPVASSIPATEHTVMTSWESELKATLNMANKYGHTVFATVADSYDYIRFLSDVLPVVAPIVKGKGGVHVIRPDSGNPVECVLQALEYCEIAYGSYLNKKGYKVLYNSAVIQGDGINLDIVKEILAAVVTAGWCATNVSFGMGGGLLQDHNRNTLSMATKASSIVYADGRSRDIMKAPKTDRSKFSLPGTFRVVRSDGIPVVFPENCMEHLENELITVYDCGPVTPSVWDESFEVTRDRLNKQWNEAPACVDVISEQLKEKIELFLNKL